MSNFSQVVVRQPPGSVVAPPWIWADTWEERPTEDVCIGLRMISDREIEDGRIEALKACLRLYPNHEKSPEVTELFIASWKDRNIRWLVGLGTCDPNDATMPWELFAGAPEDIPRDALSDKGLQFLFDAWERMRLATSIDITPATDADIALLPELVKRLPTLAAAAPTEEQRLRRLIRFVLEQLEEVPAPPTDATASP